MSTVALVVRIGGAGDGVEAPNCPAFKVSVGDANTRVNDISISALARGGVIDVAGGSARSG